MARPVAEAAAEAGMPTPLTVVTAISATTEAAATRTAAEAIEAAVKGGRGIAPEAATGLAGRRPATALAVQTRPQIMCLNSTPYIFFKLLIFVVNFLIPFKNACFK